MTDAHRLFKVMYHAAFTADILSDDLEKKPGDKTLIGMISAYKDIVNYYYTLDKGKDAHLEEKINSIEKKIESIEKHLGI